MIKFTRKNQLYPRGREEKLDTNGCLIWNFRITEVESGSRIVGKNDLIKESDVKKGEVHMGKSQRGEINQYSSFNK